MTKGKARTFGQDLMRGEHVVGGGKVKKPKPRHKPNALPSGGGGGGGGWKDLNEKMAANRAKLQKKNLTWVKGERDGELDDASRKILAAGRKAPRSYGTAEWVNEKGIEGNAGQTAGAGTSIFDPVLCELAYRWFCPPGGLVLDPFAGGSVRGIVASRLGRRYCGVDLRPEQIAANEGQRHICGDPQPEWIVGDSRNLAKLAKGVEADFVFSCPPYADLEVYSDDPADLSTLPYPEFREAYFAIVKAACELLKPDRFACFVVGDARGKDGCYYGLPEDTVAAFTAAGLRKYNEAVLVTAVGSLPIRVRKQFESGRKMGKTHQNVLVFVKGDWRKAAALIGPVEFGEPPTAEGDAAFGEPL